LETNARLEQLVAAFRAREYELRKDDFDVEDAVERHYDEVERLADYLGYRDYAGGLDRWDWAHMFVSNEGFKNLYSSDRHWLFDDFIKDDVTEFLADQNWEHVARTRMNLRERQNLLTVIGYFETAEWGPQMLRLQRLIAA
jgi:dipeptidase